MRSRIACLLLAGTSTHAAAQPAPAAPIALQLRWELKEDVFDGARGASRAAFTLTNRDTKPLPGSGWAIYFNALHDPERDTVSSGFRIEEVTGTLQRLVPGPGFAGIAPGQSLEVEYRTSLVTNRSFAPAGPYIVFDDAPEMARALNDYVAVAFERFPQGPGRDPRVVTPEAQYALDSVIRDIPLAELPLVFPSPVQAARGEGELHLAAMPTVEAAADLKGEASFAAEYLRPYFGKGRTAPATASLRLETGAVEGQSSPEAYQLLVDAKLGIRIVGASPAGVFYGLQTLRGLLPAPTPGKGLTLQALTVKDAPRFGYRGFMLDVARNFHTKASLLRTLDLLARYKLNVLHLHLTEDEAWRVEIPSLPELTSVGARRGHTLDSSRWLPPAYGSGPHIDRPWGSGFYSRADYTEILRYAAARHIEVVPEVEMPGHARAAIKAMEARARARSQAGDADGAGRYRLSDPDDRSVYTSAQGLPRQRDEPRARVHVRVRRARRVGSRGDPRRGRRSAARPPHGRRRGAGGRLGALARGPGIPRAALARERRRDVVRALRPRGADPEGQGRDTRRLGRDRCAQDEARRPADARSEPELRRPRHSRLRLEQRPRLGRRGPRVPARERRLQGRAVSRDQHVLRPRLEPEPRRARPRLGRLRRPAQALPVRPVRLLPQRAPRPPRAAARPRRVRRQGPAHRLRQGEHPRDPGRPVVRDAGRRRPARLHAGAQAARASPSGRGRPTRTGPRSAMPRSRSRSIARPGPAS